jgi:hypothetical protein
MSFPRGVIDKAKADGGGDSEGGEKVYDATRVSRRDAPASLQAAEHAFDGVAVAIEQRREAVLPFAISLRRNVGHRGCPSRLLIVTLPIGRPSVDKLETFAILDHLTTY